jgi:hypothetical protein
LALPARGRIGIFNRSYYEETVVVRVHPELLDKQNLPKTLVTENIWSERYEDINNFELHLARSGVVPVKFYLHISKEEQRERLLARIADPDKRWKFALHDVEERKLWDKFVEAYDDTIGHTATALVCDPGRSQMVRAACRRRHPDRKDGGPRFAIPEIGPKRVGRTENGRGRSARRGEGTAALTEPATARW